MNKTLYTSLLILSILGFFLSILWVIEEKQSIEAKTVLLGSIGAIITLISQMIEFKKDKNISEINLEDIVGLKHLINIKKYKIFQNINLNTTSNGINGGIVVIIDKKLRGINGDIEFQTYNGNVYIPKFDNLDNDFNYENKLQAIILIIDASLNVIYLEQLGREAARIDVVYLYENKTKPTYVITRDYSVGMGSYNGPISYFFEITDKMVTYLFDKRGFMTSLKLAWCLADNRNKKEIYHQRTSMNEFEEFDITYERFYFNNNEWLTQKFVENGFWENENGIERHTFEEKMKIK
jgi:hypothetical protein